MVVSCNGSPSVPSPWASRASVAILWRQLVGWRWGLRWELAAPTCEIVGRAPSLAELHLHVRWHGCPGLRGELATAQECCLCGRHLARVAAHPRDKPKHCLSACLLLKGHYLVEVGTATSQGDGGGQQVVEGSPARGWVRLPGPSFVLSLAVVT